MWSRIPEGECIADIAEKRVRIVPDYNPLDDMLTAQIKGAIDSDGYEDEMYYSGLHVTECSWKIYNDSRRGNEKTQYRVARNNTRNRKQTDE